MKLKKIGCSCFVLVLMGAGGGWFYINLKYLQPLQPMPSGKTQLVRFPAKITRAKALEALEKRKIIRSAEITEAYARFRGRAALVQTGTYALHPGQSADEVLAALQKPIRQAVRLPEGWWANRYAKLLEEKQVCSAASYMEFVHKPEVFKDVVSFPLPKGSLEGYLFPDTYDFPPLMGAKDAITLQLRNFEKRIKINVGDFPKLHEWVIIGSLIEDEVSQPNERNLVSGLIRNRLKEKMYLQIDATVLYAMQKWKVLGPNEVKTVVSPFNTYLHKGLPPGPIGSPSLSSLEAARNPASHGFYYYVGMPDKTSLFAKTYPEHIVNIRKRQNALKALGHQK